MLTLNQFFSPYLVLLIAAVVLFGVLYIPLLYTAYFTKNMNKVDQLLKKQKHQPIYQLYYGLAHQLDEEIDAALAKILKKYRRPEQRALFETIVKLHRQDLAHLEATIEKIQPPPYRQYYEIAYLVEKGQLKEAEQQVERVKRGWMKDVLLVDIQLKKGNVKEAADHYKKALAQTGGLQRYSIYHAYKNKL